MGLADFQLSSDGGATYPLAANVALTNTPTASNALAYNAAGTYSIKAKPVSTAGWNSFQWSIVTADDNHLASLPTVTTNPDKTCSFTVPKQGGSWTLELLVNNGLNPQTNAADPTLRNRLKIAVKNVGGAQEICVGEQYESDPSTGYSKCFNDIGRNGATAGVSSLSGLTGGLTLVAGSNVTITPAGANITIASSGSVSPGTAGQIYQTNAVPAAVWVTVTGDTTISSSGVTTTAKINGASVPAAGALTTGNAPYVSGASALTYSALNLAGGAGWITGALPLGNFATGGANTVLTGTGGTSAYSGTPTATAWLGTGTVAATGLLRAANNVPIIEARNAGNTADVSIATVDATNQVVLGEGTNSPKLALATSNATARISTLTVGGTALYGWVWDLPSQTGSLIGAVSPQSGTNITGKAAIYLDGQGTGTGASGSHLFYVAPAGGSGSSVNAYSGTPAFQISTGGVTSNLAFDSPVGITAQSFGGHSGVAFALLDSGTVSIAGTGTFTLSSAQIQCGSLRVNGTLTGNRAIQTPLAAGAHVWVYNGSTGAGFYATFGSSSGNVVWLPRNQWTECVCDGTNWFPVTFGSPFQINYTGISHVNAAGTYNTQLDTIPILAPYKALRITKAEAVVTTTIVGGNDRVSLGVASGGNTLSTKDITTAAAGTICGYALADLGTEFQSTNGYEARYTSTFALWHQQLQSTASCTAGVVAVNLVGYLEGG